MARPPNPDKSVRVYLTMPEPVHNLLAAYAHQAGRPIATVGGDILVKVMRGFEGQDTPDAAQIDTVIRALRGEPSYDEQYGPRWQWPLDVLLADSRWWRRWYPELCKLLGRKLKVPKPSRPGAGDDVVVLNAHGYGDLMEFLFPTLAGPQGAVSWRDPRYPAIAAQARAADEASQPLTAVWEAVIRHVATALAAIEEAKTGGALILVESQLQHDWLAGLLTLVGEANPPASPKLPQKRLV